ncbi:ZZ-type domain-containing protein [Favolaschia claudopus]|uniref:ZZ-type domain-containing protein n=1 Tax=Favolaschia claudopus TaxID=2862362 RepID=A0AAW0DPL2_9AGAR
MPQISSLKPTQRPAAPPTSTPTPTIVNFQCDACAQTIGSSSSRVHCLTCPDFDLCASCALGERFGLGSHMSSHPTEIYRISGDSTVSPVRSTAAITYIDVSSTSGRMGPSVTTTGGTTSNFSAPNVVHTGISTPGISTFGGTAAGGTTSTNTTTSPSSPGGWSAFFYADMNPTPIYTALMNAIFDHLDTARTGFIPPEKYSQLLDDMGYAVHENIWKTNLGNAGHEAPADTALKNIFETLNIHHIVRTRPPTSTNPPNANPFMSPFLPQPPTDSMPLLTARGLADLLAIELLGDPAATWPKLSRVIHMYRLYGTEPYRSWGVMPREVVPAAPDARILARVAGAQAIGATAAAAAINAQLHVAASIAAIDVVGGTQPQYQYRYRGY